VTSQRQGAKFKVSGKPRQFSGFTDPGDKLGAENVSWDIEGESRK
jgi:hypothetical protein